MIHTSTLSSIFFTGSVEKLFEGDIVHDYFVDDHYAGGNNDHASDINSNEVHEENAFNEDYNGCNTGTTIKVLRSLNEGC